jgi:molybdopterin-guanine dinucleotide biosynthesis protein A
LVIRLIEKLETDLLKGERKVEVWADSIGVKMVNIDCKKPDPFFNINTEEDLKKAIEILNND